MVRLPHTPANRARMRRNTTVAVSTVAVVALALSYRTSLDPSPASASPTGGGSTLPTASAASPATAVIGTSASGATTVTGDAVDTRWGTVQVEITIENGRITASDAIAAPSGDQRSTQISSYAVPLLNAQAVAAQSASIDGVSGATYTTNGYQQSLQSAIAAAAAQLGASTSAAAAETTTADAATAAVDAAPATTEAQAAASDASAAADGTFTGDVVDTRFGPVQVAIVVQDGQVASADAVASPDGDHRSVEINAYAVQQLDDQAVAAQSASIDGVSGATYTSQAYAQSLQSALDQAGLGTQAAA